MTREDKHRRLNNRRAIYHSINLVLWFVLIFILDTYNNVSTLSYLHARVLYIIGAYLSLEIIFRIFSPGFIKELKNSTKSK